MRFVRAIIFLLVAALPLEALGQQSILQGGAATSGHVPMYLNSGTSQPIVIDAGPAGGNTTGQGLSELNITARGTSCNSAQSPVVCAGLGTGVDGTIFQIQDAVATNSGGYHFLSFSANALGGGLIEYGAAGAASTLPFQFKVNGATYAFPFVTGGVVGPASSTIGHVACWNNLVGTLLSDCGALPSTTPGGSSGQIQYNNSGAFGGFTMAGDCTVSQPNITCTKINGQTVSLAGTLTTAAAFTTSGANALTLTTTTTTNVTMPATGTGTLATLAGSEAFTNKTYNGNTWTAGTGVLTIAAAKTLTASNTITFTATDGSTLAIGTGGTLGTAAYTAASAYVPSNTQITNSRGSDVALNNTSNYFTGPTVAQGSTGTWYASGTVSLVDTAGAAAMYCKLWDGTTIIDSGVAFTAGANSYITISLSGYLATPAGNITISCRDVTSASGVMAFNTSGNSKDSTVTAFRVQ